MNKKQIRIFKINRRPIKNRYVRFLLLLKGDKKPFSNNKLIKYNLKEIII